MEKQLLGSIALTKLTHVMMEKKGQSGMIKGIFIPLELNGIETKENAAYLPIKIIVRDEQDNYGQNGFITKNSKSAKPWKELSDTEKKAHQDANPILGNIKHFSTAGADASGAVNNLIVPDNGADDDLPF